MTNWFVSHRPGTVKCAQGQGLTVDRVAHLIWVREGYQVTGSLPELDM